MGDIDEYGKWSKLSLVCDGKMGANHKQTTVDTSNQIAGFGTKRYTANVSVWPMIAALCDAEFLFLLFTSKFKQLKYAIFTLRVIFEMR